MRGCSFGENIIIQNLPNATININSFGMREIWTLLNSDNDFFLSFQNIKSITNIYIYKISRPRFHITRINNWHVVCKKPLAKKKERNEFMMKITYEKSWQIAALQNKTISSRRVYINDVRDSNIANWNNFIQAFYLNDIRDALFTRSTL